MKRFLIAIQAALAIAAAVQAQDMEYTPLDGFPVLGTLAPDARERWTRLPDSLADVTRKEVWDLGQNSAGLAVRFRTASPVIKARWHNRNKFAMNHMTAAGIRGLDLYVLTPDSTWTTVCSARPSLSSATTTTTVVSGMKPGVDREYMLYLPLYDGVDSLAIGVESGYKVEMPGADLPRRGRPVVMYGTSILQGGCATRPGMAHTNILMRDMNTEVVNLGFSGNAKLDPEIARLMARADAAVYVVDAMPNCTAEMVDERMDKFLDIIREAHPATPILLVESPEFPIMRFSEEVADAINAKNTSLRTIYERRSKTDANLHYLGAKSTLLNPEYTVDNYHFTDGAFADFASVLKPILEKLIQNAAPLTENH